MKRTPHVALLMIGAGAIGGTSYALAPHPDCGTTAQQGALAGGQALPSAGRQQSSCSSHTRWSHSLWSRRSDDGAVNSLGSSDARVGTTTARGGFGLTGLSFSGHS
jgi:hypothetical protein